MDFAPGIGFNSNAVAAGILPLPGSIRGSGSVLKLDPKENNTFRVLAEAWKQGLKVEYSKSDRKYVIRGASKDRIQSWVNDYAINASLSDRSSSVGVLPRIGVYRPWTASMDMGWTRWLLDNFGISYTSVRNSDFMAGNLKDRFDVILMGSERPGVIENGRKKGEVSPRYEGGLGEQGVRNLDEFVSNGGTLVCMNQSSNFAIEALNLPVKNVVKGLNKKDFFTGGSIMAVETSLTHPVMAGMPKSANVFVSKSPVFTTLEGFKGEALAKYQSGGSALQSGYLLGSKYLNGYAASLDVHQGTGHVILLGFRPQWRGQPMGTYRILFNALLYGGQLARGHQASNDFWDAPKTEEDKDSRKTSKSNG